MEPAVQLHSFFLHSKVPKNVAELFDIMAIMGMHQCWVGTFVRIRKLLIALARYFIVITFGKGQLLPAIKYWVSEAFYKRTMDI